MIRDATTADIPRIVDMMQRFHAIASQPQEFCRDSMASFMTGLIEAPGGIVLICDGGMISGAVTPSPVNAKWLICFELSWWSERARDGVRLMKTFAERAEIMGASEIRFSFRASTPKIGKFLIKSGFTHDEQVYTRLI